MKENCLSLALQTSFGHRRINFVVVLI